jgi:hypothetical protein
LAKENLEIVAVDNEAHKLETLLEKILFFSPTIQGNKKPISATVTYAPRHT